MKLIFILLVSSILFGEDLYFGQSTAGSANGSSCANQFSAANFNNASFWGSGSGKITAGDTAHLCGVVTSQLTVLGSGSSGNLITITFESGAKISLPSCDNSNGCLDIDGRSWLVIDGGTACGPSTACALQEIASPIGTPQTGTIENTLNGATIATCFAGTCNQHVSARGISAINSTHIEIKNLIVRNMFVHVSCPGNSSPTQCNVPLSSDSGILSFQDTNSVSFLIHDSTIHDGRELITIAPTNSAVESGFQIYNVDLFHTAGGIKIADSTAPSSITALVMHNLHIHDLANWDADDCVGAYHLDGVHMWGLSGATNSNVSFYDSVIDGDFGGCQTGTLFFEGENDNIQVYNNLINTTYTQNNNGMMNLNGTGFEVYNNTINGADSGGDIAVVFGRPSGSPSVKFRNNIVAGANTLVLANNSTVYTTWDNNIYGQCNNTGCNSGTPFVLNGGASFDTFAQWKTACSCDASSQYGASMTFAKLNSNGTLQVSSPAIGAGANLTSLGITPLNTDLAGASRPSGAAAWDIGAYQFSGGSTVANPTDSPGQGTYPTSQAVTLSDSTSGAAICYRTDGTAPAATTPGTCDGGSSTYSSPFTLSATATVKALGTKAALTNSGILTSIYTIQNATPTDSPGAGTYSGAQTVTLSSSTPSAVICYTLNGSTPAASTPGTCSAGTTYSGGFAISVTSTLKALATKSGLTNSGVLSSSYVINYPSGRFPGNGIRGASIRTH